MNSTREPVEIGSSNHPFWVDAMRDYVQLAVVVARLAADLA